MKCNKCENIVPDDSSFCPFCGEKIESNKCTQCGNTLPEDSLFCPFCGQKVESVAPAKTELKRPKASKTVSHPKAKKIWTRILIIAAAILVAAALTVFLIIPGAKYFNAKRLLSSGEYSRAYSEFTKLGSFWNSAEMLSETNYLYAKAYRDSGDFEKANVIFKSLGDYKDSKQLIHYHAYQFSKTVEPSCTEAGCKVFTCGGCGDEHIETLASKGHNYEAKVTKAATCTTPGEKLYYCTACDAQYTEPIKIIAHNYEAKNSTASTCTKAGETTFVCSECDNSYVEALPIKDHEYKLTTSQKATCTKEGTEKYACSCGLSYTKTISKLAHSYSAATCTTAKTCKTCGTTDGSPLGHTNTAVCTRCEKTLFTTQKYSGTGPGSISNITLPNGVYNFIFTHAGTGNFIVKFNRGTESYERLIVNEIGNVSYTAQVNVTDSSPVKNGFMNITNARGSWTVTIQVAGQEVAESEDTSSTAGWAGKWIFSDATPEEAKDNWFVFDFTQMMVIWNYNYGGGVGQHQYPFRVVDSMTLEMSQHGDLNYITDKFVLNGDDTIKRIGSYSKTWTLIPQNSVSE